MTRKKTKERANDSLDAVLFCLAVWQKNRRGSLLDVFCTPTHQQKVQLTILLLLPTTWVELVRPISLYGRYLVMRRHFLGWLFLFAVLMAAGLLFTMVFFVSYSLYPYPESQRYWHPPDYHVLRPRMRLHKSYRSLQQAQPSEFASCMHCR